ncbi:MAG: antibiotic biosynthesis monooxygenase family protein, partial [Gammaproteobacteria bacterium]
LKGEKGREATVFLSHSQWDSEQSFVDWTRSEAFRLAHQNAKLPEGILLGHPEFEGYTSIDLPDDG